MNICCVVVTYNRKKLLAECLNALINQTYKIKDIIVIDNNSSDGTEEYLNENKFFEVNNLNYIKLTSNIGGAGGFNEGIKQSLNKNYDWVWVMDDDCIPDERALEELVKSMEILKDENISFLCSKVIGPENEEMNVPVISEKRLENGYPLWMKYLNKGIVAVESATFVSVLIKTDAIKTVGLPWKEFFIWGDDIEYTLRLNKYYGQGYAIGTSKVLHKRVQAKVLSIYEENNINRINMYKYKYRNDILLLEYRSLRRKIIVPLEQFTQSISILFKNDKYKFRKSFIIFSSTINAILNISLRRKFKNRMSI